MGRRLVAAVLLAMTMCYGCQTTPSQDVFDVMFEGPPKLFDSGVYRNGSPIGEVVSVETGNGNVTRVRISVDSPYISEMTDNMVGVVIRGRLELAPIAKFGNPLPYESKILGFQSKLALVGFKMTHVITPRPTAASEKARRLFELSADH